MSNNNFIFNLIENQGMELLKNLFKNQFGDFISDINSSSKYNAKSGKYTITFKIVGNRKLF